MLYAKWEAVRIADERTARYGVIYVAERVARGEWQVVKFRGRPTVRIDKAVRQARRRVLRRANLAAA
jgi:hypothetical protein